MFKFIKLTESCADRSRKKVLLNLNLVKCFQSGDKSRDTHVAMSDGRYYFVVETLKQIQVLIDIDTSKAPVIMTAEEALKYFKDKDGC